MNLRLERINSDKQSSIGVLYIDGIPFCYILEDEYRTEKKYGETRIPAGVYDVTLRSEGGFHSRYASKFPDMHKGMLAISNKPNYVIENDGLKFQYVLIHIGNTDDDSAGCLLTGADITKSGGEWKTLQSTAAYKKIYPIIANEIASGCPVEIEVVNTDLSIKKNF